jgi:hypothetical protein
VTSYSRLKKGENAQAVAFKVLVDEDDCNDVRTIEESNALLPELHLVRIFNRNGATWRRFWPL